MRLPAERSNDLYIMVSCATADGVMMPEPARDSDRLAASYLAALEVQSRYECSSGIHLQLSRSFCGAYELACTTDNYGPGAGERYLEPELVLDTVMAHAVLTGHRETGLHILTLILAGNHYDPTQIEDQMSTNHLYLKDNTGHFLHLDVFLRERLGLARVDEPRCVLCVTEKPEERRELLCMLAAESANSQHVDYQNISKEIESIAARNVAQYDFYEAYVSSKCLLYILPGRGEDYFENMEDEAAIIFICELILFQNAAVARANQRIIDELTTDHKISLRVIEDMYTEFGRTIHFWDENNFRYLLPQNLSNAISSAFETDKLLERYCRNRSHLEHIVELRGSQSAEREGKVINIIAILLAVVQIIPLLIEGWGFLVGNLSTIDIRPVLTVSGCATLLVVLLAVYNTHRRRGKRK